MILFEVLTRDTFIDDLGTCYDVAIYWNNAYWTMQPPSSVVNPNGAEVVVECLSSDTEEMIRDRIRDAVISVLEADFDFTSLTRDMIRVDGYTNETTNEHAGSGSPPPIIWYAGPPKPLAYPSRDTTGKRDRRIRIGEVTTTVLFNSSLSPEQRPDLMSAEIVFVAKYPPAERSRLIFYMEGYDSQGTWIWEAPLSLWVQSGHRFMTSVISLNHVDQAPLWSTGLVEFRLTVSRSDSVRTMNAAAGGVLTSAQIGFVWA